jgi:hypothetical protein
MYQQQMDIRQRHHQLPQELFRFLMPHQLFPSHHLRMQHHQHHQRQQLLNTFLTEDRQLFGVLLQHPHHQQVGSYHPDWLIHHHHLQT